MTPLVMVIEKSNESGTPLSCVVKEHVACRTIEAVDWRSGIRHLLSAQSPQPDGVITGIPLQGIEPREAFGAFRSLKPGLFIIACVMHADECAAALHHGADDFVMLPPCPHRLQVTLRHLLRLKRMAEELEALRSLHTQHGANGHVVSGNGHVGNGVIRVLGEDNHVFPLRRMEKEAIRLALKHYDGCISHAARRLGIGRSTLYRKMDELNIAYERELISAESYVKEPA